MASRLPKTLGMEYKLVPARVSALVPLQGFMTNKGKHGTFRTSAIREILAFLPTHTDHSLRNAPHRLQRRPALAWACQRQCYNGDNNLFALSSSSCSIRCSHLTCPLHRLSSRTTNLAARIRWPLPLSPITFAAPTRIRGFFVPPLEQDIFTIALSAAPV